MEQEVQLQLYLINKSVSNIDKNDNIILYSYWLLCSLSEEFFISFKPVYIYMTSVVPKKLLYNQTRVCWFLLSFPGSQNIWVH